MECTACTEPQCLYKGDLYLYLLLAIDWGYLTFSGYFYLYEAHFPATRQHVTSLSDPRSKVYFPLLL